MKKADIIFALVLVALSALFAFFVSITQSMVAKWIWGIIAVGLLALAIYGTIDAIKKNKRKQEMLDIFASALRETSKMPDSAQKIRSTVSAAKESVVAAAMIEKDQQENGIQTKKNVVMQPERLVIHSPRTIMTKGVPADYFFAGDNSNPSATLRLMAPLKIDVDNAVKNGIPGKQTWDGSKCFLAAENEDYRFYIYGCYSDKSGGCNIRQSKKNPKEVVFFGKAREHSCIFHNKLVQISSSAYGDELYLFVKDIDTGKEKIYPWFGKYAIPTDRGSRYDQDSIQSIRVDEESDTIVIEVSRAYYINPSPDDCEAVCNADTNYTMTVSYDGEDLRAKAYFPELNVEVIFDNQY